MLTQYLFVEGHSYGDTLVVNIMLSKRPWPIHYPVDQTSTLSLTASIRRCSFTQHTTCHWKGGLILNWVRFVFSLLLQYSTMITSISPLWLVGKSTNCPLSSILPVLRVDMSCINCVTANQWEKYAWYTSMSYLYVIPLRHSSWYQTVSCDTPL